MGVTQSAESATAAPIAQVARETAANDVRSENSSSDRTSEIERRNLILEAKSEIEQKAYNQFSLIMAGLGGVITLLVLGFGFISHRAAVNAARLEMLDLKLKVDDIRKEADLAKCEAIDAAESARGAATSALTAAQGALAHQQTAQEASEKIREAAALSERLSITPVVGGAAELSQAERETVSDAAREVGDKPERDWTGDDFRVKILEAYDQANWVEMLRLAQGMEFLHNNDPELQAFALFQQAKAQERSGELDLAARRYGELADRFGDFDNQTVQNTALQARVNQSILLTHAGKEDVGLSVAQEVIAKHGAVEDLTKQRQVAKALIVQGVLLGRQGKEKEGRAAFRVVLEKFGQSDDAELQAEVIMAMYNLAVDFQNSGQLTKAIRIADEIYDQFGSVIDEDIYQHVTDEVFYKARLLGFQKKIKACIGALEMWNGRLSSFDCEKVMKNQAFAELLSRPTFQGYLRKHGCLTDSTDQGGEGRGKPALGDVA